MKKIHKSLKASFWDGVFASGMVGMVESYITPYALALKALPAQIGLLGSLPQLVNALAQTQIGRMSAWAGSRKSSILTLVGIQVIILVLFPFVPLLPSSYQMTGLIILAVGYTCFYHLAGPPWASLMCEYLPLSRRSGYFGWRNRFMGHIIIGSCLLGGGILHFFGKLSLLGFALLFMSAAIFRLISYFYIREMHEPRPLMSSPKRRIPATEQIKIEGNFNAFLAFSGFMTFSAHLVAPLFAVYMLRDLHFSYLTYTLLTIASNYSMFFMMATWGRHADHIGNLSVIRIASLVIPILPLLWIISRNPVFMFCIQIFGGAVWAGYNLCMTNYIYDSVAPTQRIEATSRFNMVNGLCIFLGAYAGSRLLGVLPSLGGYRFYSLLVLSAMGRLAATLIFLPRVKEIRRVSPVKPLDLVYSVMGLKPIPAMAAYDVRPQSRRPTEP